MDDLLAFFKLLSDEMRLRIILLLSRQVLCVCELCEILNVPQPRMSQQLAKLRDLGFVQDERKGQWMMYRLNLSDSVVIKIVTAIEENLDRYPVLAQDLEDLHKLEADHQLCNSRINKLEG